MGWRGDGEGRTEPAPVCQENHSKGSLLPAMYHRCPSLLRVSALTLQERSSYPGGWCAWWDGPRTVLKTNLGKPPAPDLS